MYSQRHDLKVQCPYCFEKIWLEFYPEEGENQEQIIDCEVCCNPVLYRVNFRGTGKPTVQASRAD
jgi:hypothetical protein